MQTRDTAFLDQPFAEGKLFFTDNSESLQLLTPVG